MALSAYTIWEVETGGSDTACSGGFDPSQTAGMLTDGAATAANTAAPVFTSASYNFAAGDVGAWVYISSGTNWIPGWYKIASVASNAATLNATIGAAVKSTGSTTPLLAGPTTATGCATTASPTAAMWTIDYSQQSSARYAYTDIISVGAGSTCTSAAHPFSSEQVGNSLIIASGTNINVGVYIIASVSAGTATVIGPSALTTGAAVGGTGSQGGAYISPGKAGSVHVGGNKIAAAKGTYSISSASSNVPGGVITLAAGVVANDTILFGYNTVRGDNPPSTNRPLFQAGTITAFIMVTIGAHSVAEFIMVDGVSKTTSRGFLATASSTVYRCKALNCTNTAFVGSANTSLVLCEATGGSAGQPAFSGGVGYGCIAYANAATGFVNGIWIKCISAANTGASTHGFNSLASNIYCMDCTSANNGANGFNFTATSAQNVTAVNCISANNVGFGYAGASSTDIPKLYNCASCHNTAGDTSNLPSGNLYNFLALASDPFTNASGGDFSLNSSATGGGPLRSAGILGVWPALISTTGFEDFGANQHQGVVSPPNPITAMGPVYIG